jgi:(R,R)-butanediol dehydrogenase/meso-butanediol dehydrogenase/diacetyl reductase
MRAAVMEGKKKLVIIDAPDPVLNKDEVLIKVRYCGICGSDLHIYVDGLNLGLGHEWSGDIVEMGPDVKGWEIGDPVVVEFSGCGECYWCKRGEMGLCDRLVSYITGRRIGGFATYVKAKYGRLLKLPDGMTYEQGAIVEPTDVALHALNISGMKLGDVVAVLGLGPIGQLAARLAKLNAKAVYATEINQSRIELARNVVDEVVNPKVTDPVDRILELTGGMGPDIVFECAGKVATVEQSIALARKGGTIVIVSNCFDAVETSFMDIVLKGLTIKGSLSANVGDYASAFHLIKNRRIDVNPLFTDKFPLEDINEAFEKALKGEGGKILIKP